MSVTIDQVPCWIIVNGISHAVSHTQDPGTYTGCGLLFWGVYPPRSKSKRKKHNGRICAKCRKAIERATFPGGGA